MKWWVSLLVVMFLLGPFGGQTVSAQTATTCGSTYRVQPEDYFSTIAVKCHVPYEDLVAANPQIEDPNIIYPGETIHIPQSDSEQGVSVTGGSVYVVQPGDTLSKISARFQVRVDQLAQANLTLQPDSSVIPGRVLTLPQGAARVPTLSVSPTFGQAGDSITLAATGFRAAMPVVIGLGEVNQAINQVLETKTDANGAAFQSFDIPDWVQPGRTYVFVIQRRDEPTIRATSNQFVVRGDSPTIPVTGSFIYGVKKGDTLQGLAERYHTNEETLLAINPAIGPAKLIYPGQQLRITGAVIQPTGKAVVFVSMQSAHPGDMLQVMGVHFPVSANVDVRLAQQGSSYSAVIDARTNQAGLVTASIPIPSFAQNNEQWVAIITTTEKSAITRAVSQPIHIVSTPHYGPWVGVSSTSVKPGEVIQVKAQNFPVNARVDVRAGQVGQPFTVVKDAQIDNQGRVSSSIQIPQAASKDQKWVVTVTTTDRRDGVQATSQPVLVIP